MELFEKIRKGLELKGVKSSISKTSSIKDLGLDSLDLMDLVTNLEESENVRIDDDTLMNIKTINDIIEAVQKLKK